MHRVYSRVLGCIRTEVIFLFTISGLLEHSLKVYLVVKLRCTHVLRHPAPAFFQIPGVSGRVLLQRNHPAKSALCKHVSHRATSCAQLHGAR